MRGSGHLKDWLRGCAGKQAPHESFAERAWKSTTFAAQTKPEASAPQTREVHGQIQQQDGSLIG